MKFQETNNMYSQDNAEAYDAKRDKIIAIKDALHLCIRMLLLKSPADARVLCVGAGTGSELIYLAQAFPNWNFTVVEPASEMLKICQKRAKEYGFLSRCTFHEGYLDSLPETKPFDIATSILVSHFFTDKKDRSTFFLEIALRLKPGAYMINADLASDMSSSVYKGILEVWENMHGYANMPIRTKSFGTKVALEPVKEIELILKSSGFDAPVLFFQTLLIHAWFSKVSNVINS